MPKTRPGDEQNIASFAVDLICALGASKVFTLTGGMAMYLNRATATQPDLAPVYVQHEQAAVAAADGYAKALDYVAPGRWRSCGQASSAPCGFRRKTPARP